MSPAETEAIREVRDALIELRTAVEKDTAATCEVLDRLDRQLNGDGSDHRPGIDKRLDRLEREWKSRKSAERRVSGGFWSAVIAMAAAAVSAIIALFGGK